MTNRYLALAWFAAACMWVAVGSYGVAVLYFALAGLYGAVLPSSGKPKELTAEERYEKWLWDPNDEIKLPALEDLSWLDRNLKDLRGTELEIAKAARKLYAEDKLTEKEFERLMERALNPERKITREEYDEHFKGIPGLKVLAEHFERPALPPGPSNHSMGGYVVPSYHRKSLEQEKARKLSELSPKCKQCGMRGKYLDAKYKLCSPCIEALDARDAFKNRMYSTGTMVMPDSGLKMTPFHECKYAVGNDRCIYCDKAFGTDPFDTYYIPKA